MIPSMFHHPDFELLGTGSDSLISVDVPGEAAITHAATRNS
jgi:hypothetical protein